MITTKWSRSVENAEYGSIPTSTSDQQNSVQCLGQTNVAETTDNAQKLYT